MEFQSFWFVPLYIIVISRLASIKIPDLDSARQLIHEVYPALPACSSTFKNV